ncbi:MAG: aminotransferase class V-fold PLP-dependent enzyme [Saprospiraceae bacterium]|nr:aminotransferase class V-fold PLP-dependent enzyme [Saprospiraceae bacterium]
MLERIKQLESTAKGLEPRADLRDEFLAKAHSYGERFLEDMDRSKVYESDGSAVRDLDRFKFDDEGKDLDSLLEVLGSAVDATGINPAGPTHFGYVPGGGVYPSALGDYLVDITNRYAGITFANPGAVRMENILIEWMAEMVGYPIDAIGNLASGGSIASLIAIVAARDHYQITPEKVRSSVVYCTKQIHHCLLKAFRIAGLHYAVVRFVPVDERFAMKTQVLSEMIQEDLDNGLHPFLIMASAGSTDVGAIDPLDEIGRVAKSFDCWFHIDAAYGGFFMLVDSMRHKFRGMDTSDSIVIDPHKGLFLPYGTGAVLVKNKQAVLQSHHYRANYMQDAFTDEEEISPADVSPELTKHFRGLRMWLPMQLLGLAPFKASLEEKILLCQYFYDRVQALGFEAGPEPTLSICLFRWTAVSDANTFNKAILKEIQMEGSHFISSTTIGDTFWLRVCIMVFRTHLSHVDAFLLQLRELITTVQEKESAHP